MELDDEQEACVLRGARLVSDTDRDEYFSLISTYLKSLREISMTDCRYAVSCAIQMLQPHRVRQRGAVQDDSDAEEERREIELWREAVRQSILRAGRKRRRRSNNNSASRDANDKGDKTSD